MTTKPSQIPPDEYAFFGILHGTHEGLAMAMDNQFIESTQPNLPSVEILELPQETPRSLGFKALEISLTEHDSAA